MSSLRTSTNKRLALTIPPPQRWKCYKTRIEKRDQVRSASITCSIENYMGFPKRMEFRHDVCNTFVDPLHSSLQSVTIISSGSIVLLCTRTPNGARSLHQISSAPKQKKILHDGCRWNPTPMDRHAADRCRYSTPTPMDRQAGYVCRQCHSSLHPK